MVRGGECTGRRSSITSAEPQPSRRHLLRSLPTFAALQHREFRLLWAGQVATAMAGWMAHVARGDRKIEAAPETRSPRKVLVSGGFFMVAGAGFEPAAFGL